jgi:hypothetical protein
MTATLHNLDQERRTRRAICDESDPRIVVHGLVDRATRLADAHAYELLVDRQVLDLLVEDVCSVVDWLVTPRRAAR